MNLFEVMELGPIIVCDEDLGILITYNASYFNLFIIDGDRFKCTDCRYVGLRETQDIWDIVKEGERYLEDVLKEIEDEK